MKKKLLAWDTFAIIKGEVESRRESGEYQHLNDDELFRQVCEDYDLFNSYWQDMCDALTKTMEKRNPDGWWGVEMRNFGWRELDGYKAFRADTGEELLQQILPKTENTFYIYDHDCADGQGFAINNFHHDSPAGREWYYVEPLAHVECQDCWHVFPYDDGERAFIGKHGVCSLCYEDHQHEHEEKRKS